MPVFNKILVIRFSSIGDIILASPLLHLIRRAHPAAQITFMIKSEFAELVKFNPAISSLIELKTGTFAELRGLRRTVRAAGFDAVIDIHNSLRSRYLRMGSAARVTGVVKKFAVRRFLLVHTKQNFYKEIVPVSERYIRAAKNLGLPDELIFPEIFVPADVAKTVTSKLHSGRIFEHPCVIGLAPSAKHATKRWPPERFVDLGVRLSAEKNAKILILGGKADIDLCGELAQMVNVRTQADTAVSAAGRLSLLETAAALDYCRLVVSNDTGIMHLAAARKRPVVAIFGSTVREFGFFPVSEQAVIVERPGLPCRPCSSVGRDRCPKRHFSCMKDIGVEEVAAASGKLLAMNL